MNLLLLILDLIISLIYWALFKKLILIFIVSATLFTSMFLTILTKFISNVQEYLSQQVSALIQVEKDYHTEEDIQNFAKIKRCCICFFSLIHKSSQRKRFAFNKPTVTASKHVLCSWHLQTDCLPVCSGIFPYTKVVSWSYTHWSNFHTLLKKMGHVFKAITHTYQRNH